MKKFNKLALLVASATMAMSVGSAAFAQSHVTDEDNWKNTDGTLVWKTGVEDVLCWRDNFWTPETANAECDGALAAPAAEVIPEKTKPATGATWIDEPVILQADALFDFDKATLKAAGKKSLDELVYGLNQIDNVEAITIEGHTDSIGADAYNQKLSVRRAEAVKAYLVSKGIPSDAIYVEGKGESAPVATNKTREGRALNRRVEVQIDGTKEVEIRR